MVTRFFWNVIRRFIAGAVWIASVAGATRDDALAWVLTLMPWFENPWVWVAGFTLTGIAIGWDMRVLCARWFASSPLEIRFPNLVNSDSIVSLFHQATAVVPDDGAGTGRPLAEHSFRIAVENNSSRTARNVRVVANKVSPPPWPVEIIFKPDDSDTGRVDIQPHTGEFFVVLKGHDMDRACTRTKLVSQQEYGTTLGRALEPTRVAARLVDHRDGRSIQVLANDEQHVWFSVIADDIPARTGFMIINARTRLELLVYRSERHWKWERFKRSSAAKARSYWDRATRKKVEPTGEPRAG